MRQGYKLIIAIAILILLVILNIIFLRLTKTIFDHTKNKIQIAKNSTTSVVNQTNKNSTQHIVENATKINGNDSLKIEESKEIKLNLTIQAQPVIKSEVLSNETTNSSLTQKNDKIDSEKIQKSDNEFNQDIAGTHEIMNQEIKEINQILEEEEKNILKIGTESLNSNITIQIDEKNITKNLGSKVKTIMKSNFLLK